MEKFIPQYEPHIKKSYIKAVSKQMASGWIGTSTVTELFERELAEYHEVKHVISTTSGTMALLLGIVALDLPKDKKILFPSYTFLAGANVIKFLGYEIEFIDVHKFNLCMDGRLLEERLAKRSDDVSAVVFVAHNAFVGHISGIADVCKKYNIKLIEDTAQCVGFPLIGTLGEFGVLSFSVPKLITTGQGGAVLTNNDDIAEKVKRLRDHGDNWRLSKLHNFIGVNLKFNDIAASLGMAQLKILDDLKEHREDIFCRYQENGIDLLSMLSQGDMWMAIHFSDNADKLIEQLKFNNIQAVKYYRPITSNPPFFCDTKYPQADYVYEHYVYLPSSLTLKNKDIDRICKIIKRIEDE